MLNDNDQKTFENFKMQQFLSRSKLSRFLCSGPRILVKIAPIKSNKKKKLYLCYNSNINPIVFCSLAVVLTICHLRDVRNTISGARQAQLSLSILMATCIWRNKIKIFASGMKLSNRVVSISPVNFSSSVSLI